MAHTILLVKTIGQSSGSYLSPMILCLCTDVYTKPLSTSANSSDFVYDLFEYMHVSESGGGRKPTMMGKRGGKPSRKKATVSSQFKVSAWWLGRWIMSRPSLNKELHITCPSIV